MTRRRRIWLTCAALALAAPPVALWIASWFVALPAELTDGGYASSQRVLDRHGALLRHVRAGDSSLAQRVTLEDVGPDVVAAIVAAEDRRFFWHPGVDPLAILRATAQTLWSRRIVSGASTLTQQLARTLRPRPRTLWGKLGEAALALRIERSLSKRRVLEEYLSRVAFAPRVRGVEAASLAYFDKPARALSLGEAAALAGMPRGPSLYDPRKHRARLLARRAVVLSRLRGVDPARVRAAQSEPLALTEARAPALAPHLLAAVTRGPLAPPGPFDELETTIDAGLQREVEALVASTTARLRPQRATAAAAVVVDNATGELLAYVGSPDALDRAALGANDGVLARRQPGSSLKPFVYELGFERRHLTAATVLPDLPLAFTSRGGEFRPRDYDGKFHGPVRAREALASSLNVPAVALAEQLGPDRVLTRLRELGFDTLDEDASRYGVGLALGDGEVRLLDLAGAYVALARGGERVPLRAVSALRRPGGARIELARPPPTRVMDEEAAAIVTDVLSDDAARAMAFGRHGVLELPFPVAVKTGTSKGFRDNITVGSTRERTVAVWVGNFDGSPMHGVSGVSGAGPLFRDVMLAATRQIEAPGPLATSGALESREVCALSGALSGPRCPHATRELFLPGTAPTEECGVHVEVRVNPRDGLAAGPACRGAVTRVLERYSHEYAAWARAAGRPVAPTRASPECPAGASVGGDERDALAIVEPREHARYLHDPTLGAREAVLIRASGATGDARVWLDGRPLPPGPLPGSALARPAPGEHRVWVESRGRRSEVVEFVVE